MGMNLGNMSKMLKCGGNDDIVTIKADDGGDSVTFMFESPSMFFSFAHFFNVFIAYFLYFCFVIILLEIFVKKMVN